MRYILCMTMILLWMASCSTSRSSNGSDDQLTTPFISLHKGACFGTCPVYRFSIYDNGDFVYEAFRFHESHGLFMSQIPEKDLEDVMAMTEEISWNEYPEYFESEIPDLPSTTLTYGSKRIQFREEAPDELRIMAEHLEAMAKNAQKALVVASSQKEFLGNEVLRVQFKPNAFPDSDFQKVWRPVLRSIEPVVGEEGVYDLLADVEMISLGQAYYALTNNPTIQSVRLK